MRTYEKVNRVTKAKCVFEWTRFPKCLPRGQYFYTATCNDYFASCVVTVVLYLYQIFTRIGCLFKHMQALTIEKSSQLPLHFTSCVELLDIVLST